MHRYIYNGNWKLQVENVLDSYHVPFGHASTVNKDGVQFARREGDQKGAAIVETQKKETAGTWKDRKSYIVGNGHGWTSNTALDDGKRSSLAFDDYKRVLAEKVGAERAAQILKPRLHNTLIYPNVSIMGLNIHVRVIKPLAVDRTEVTIYPIRLVGAPPAMNFGNIRLLNVTHSAASFVQTDDLESFVRTQRGLQSRQTDWVDIARSWQRGTGPRTQRHARPRDPRDGRARPIQVVACLYARGGVMDGAHSTGAAQIDREPFEHFLFHEAHLLDQRRFRDWMALFAEDGTYWVPAVPNQDSPFDQASLFYDDRDLMKTRVDRLEHPRIHVQTPPSRTAHISETRSSSGRTRPRANMSSGPPSSWSNTATTSSASSPDASSTGSAARAQASVSSRSASISSIATAPSRRLRCRSDRRGARSVAATSALTQGS